VPYWSIDLLYGFGFLLCSTPVRVDRHALRLLSVQLVCVAFFVLLPLRFSLDKPITDGMFGQLFDALASFDQPYNQAPSLHIALLVVIWQLFRGASTGAWRVAVDAWALLITISVLTTYQHHFIDIPTGALAGLFGLWLWPDRGASPLRGRAPLSRRGHRLALAYATGAALAVSACAYGGIAWIALWPATSLALVAGCYSWAGASGFQKSSEGLSLASRWLFGPYRAAAWLNSRIWTRSHPEATAIVDGLYLGRFPSRSELAGARPWAVCDLTAEFPPIPSCVQHRATLPLLDLISPDPQILIRAAHEIERLRGLEDRVLVCCALGYGRSALAVTAWLRVTGRASSVEEAAALVRAKQPHSAMHEDALEALALALESARDSA